MTASVFNSVPSLSMLRIGAIILSLAPGYYYFKKASLIPTNQAVSASVSSTPESTPLNIDSG